MAKSRGGVGGWCGIPAWAFSQLAGLASGFWVVVSCEVGALGMFLQRGVQGSGSVMLPAWCGGVWGQGWW